MEEDSTAAAPPPGPRIVVEDDDDIVEMIGAPKLLMGGGIGKAHGPVVVAVQGRIAPAVVAGDHLEGKRRCGWCYAVATEENPAKAPQAPGCGAIALALVGLRAASAEKTGKCEAARLEKAQPGSRRDRVNVQSCDDFPHGELFCEGPCGHAWSN